MPKLTDIDNNQAFDWGKTSEDYALHRPGPPASFYEQLREIGVGIPGQAILDMGTGTGFLARTFAKQGARVAAIDISKEQIAMAKQLAQKDQLTIDFKVSAAEEAPFADHCFDVITANQCLLYFNKPEFIKQARRLLRKTDGLVIDSHFSWLPRQSEIAKQSETLILKYNPHWNGCDYSGEVIPMFDWAKDDFELKHLISYTEEIAFSKASWCGRVRASRGIAATLSPAAVEKFDQEHQQLLDTIATDEFTISHQIVIRAMVLKPVVCR